MDIQKIVNSQFYAALEMMKQVISKCPADLWLDDSAPNPFWQVTYHALFFVHFYLQPAENDFIPWANGRPNYHFLALSPEEAAELPDVLEPYTTAELLDYATWLQQYLDEIVPRLDFAGPSGFPWLPFTKLEQQFYSVRHLQGHVGELSQRLIAHNSNLEIQWVGRKR
jgi:hypothetical protein